ncbi:uncharacterized protein [Solanum lycopersicum]|uniref:uncharacterized protein n=1 Tax=Solanum lycopersicum TaxID=4081 RepID=UPI00374A4AB7
MGFDMLHSSFVDQRETGGGLIRDVCQLDLLQEGTSFQSIVSVAKEAKLMEREKFGDPKRARIYQGGQTSRGSYGPGQGSYGSQQRRIGRGNYSGFSGSTQQFPGQRFCFTCGDPDHLMRQCTSQRSRGGPRPNSSFHTRPPAPQGRGRGRVLSGRGVEFLVVVLQLNRLRVERLVERGCLSYLAFIRDTSVEPHPMDSVPVVQEFPDVFLSDLPGVPPDRDIDFAIGLEPGTKPISIPPYRIAPEELKELKDQLQDLLRKANVVADALSRKTPSMGSLAVLSIMERPLARDVQILANSLVRLQISEEILRGEAKEAVLDSDGVLRIGGKICVPKTGDLIRLILEEAHCSRLTKSAHFIPVRVKYTAEKLAKLYISQIVRLHGVPISIISDRDGQSERTIQVLEDMLRTCVIAFGARWDQHLALAEFANNNSYHSSIQMAPFEALYGRRYLTFEEEPIAILNRQVRKLRTKEIFSVKVQRKHRSVGEATWETESDMRARYPQLFEVPGIFFVHMFGDEHDFSGE